MAKPEAVTFPEQSNDIFSQLMQLKGFPFGILFSLGIGLLVSFVTIACLWLIFTEIAVSFYAISGFLLFVCLFGVIFWTGLRFEDGPDGVKQNEKGLQLIFGERTHGESPEGLYWALPRPFIKIQQPPYNTKTRLLNLCFTKGGLKMIGSDGEETFTDGKPIVFADGSQLKRADITIIFRVKDGHLFDVSTIDVEAYVKEIGENAVRSAATMLTKFIKDDYKEKHFRGIDSVALLGSLTKWENFILNGGSKTTLDARGKEVTAPVIDTATWKHIDPKKYTEYEKKVVCEIDGVAQAAANVGIEILGITISSTELPDDIQSSIDSELVEVTEQKKFVKDAETFQKIIATMLKDSEVDGKPSITYADAHDFALIAQDKKNARRITIAGSGSGTDKLAAALASKGDL